MRPLSVVAALVVVGSIAFALRPSPRPPVPVNLLLVCIDTLRPDHTSAHGYERKTTPNLDALARTGVRFADATSHAPWTLPSVASLLTSQYPSQHGAAIGGALRNLQNDIPTELGTTATLPSILRRHGRRAHAITANAFVGYGVDAQFDDFTYAHETAERVTTKALHFLRRHQDEPFFLYLHYTDPHEHHTLPPRRYRRRYVDGEVVDVMREKKRSSYQFIHDNFGFALYDGQIEFVDAQIGRVLEKLDQLRLRQSTLVVVFSDHGEEFWEHEAEHRRYGTDPRGYYGIGHGQSLYQELLSVVLILAGGNLPEGIVVEGAVGLRDVPVTILELMNLPRGDEMKGTSLVPDIQAGRAREREVYSEAIAYGYEKKSLRRGHWKYIYSLPGESNELYDLDTDPRETRNVAGQHPDTTEAMRARVFEIMAENSDTKQTKTPSISEEMRRNLQALGYLTDSPRGLEP